MNRSFILVSLAVFVFAPISATAHEHSDHSYKKERKKMMQEHRQEKMELRMEHMRNKMHERVDANEDGLIDLSEYLAHAEARFTKLDLDSDGVVTKQEAKESMMRMREERHKKRKERREEKMKAE